MPSYTLSFTVGPASLYGHDAGVVLLKNGEISFGVENERFSRKKHGDRSFPRQAIQASIDHEDIELPDVDKIIVPSEPEYATRSLLGKLPEEVSSGSARNRISNALNLVYKYKIFRYTLRESLKSDLEEIGSPVPQIETASHHKCHAASSFYPSGFEEALTFTIDGRGEYASTVIWKCESEDVSEINCFEYPNSLGTFYGVVTEYLGYRRLNGEGKVMGLAPYGNQNDEIESTFRDVIDVCADYDVTPITKGDWESRVTRLESIFDRPQNQKVDEFSQWYKDFAYTAQKILEEIVLGLVEKYCRKYEIRDVTTSGGVALNCKLNKEIMQSEYVDNLFVQPVANDAGIPIGGAMLNYNPSQIPEMDHVYWGPEYSTETIINVLDSRKIEYTVEEDIERTVAKRISDGALVGWYQDRVEMGPRALGNRSILADPRTIESREQVNKFVKHREGWRPFAPSMTEAGAENYLVNAQPAPYMIKAFNVQEEATSEIPAVLHPADDTTRPQTVNEDQNPKYHKLITEFEDVTGVPVLLNTSFNDHGEPIVNKPEKAINDFFQMGLDILVLNDVIVEKT